MPRNKSTRGERGKMDAINNEQDPKKRMKMIIDRKMNDTKVSNQLNDIMNKRFGKYKSQITEEIVSKKTPDEVFRKILNNEEFKTDHLTTAFVAILDCNQHTFDQINNAFIDIPLKKGNFVELCMQEEKEMRTKKQKKVNHDQMFTKRDKEKLRFKLRKIDQDIEALETEGGNFSKKERQSINAMLKDLEDERTEMIREFIESMQNENEEIVEKWETRKGALEQKIKLRDQEDEDEKRKMKERELKSRKQIQKYFEEMKRKHQKKMEKAMKRAQKRAERSQVKESESEPSEDSLTPSPTRIRMKVPGSGWNYQDEYNKYRQSRLEKIKELHKPMDYQALKKHQEDIEKMIKKRKEENEKKIIEAQKIDNNLFKLMNSFKSKNNEFYVKRSRYEANQRKKKKFDEMVRRNYKPNQRDYPSEDEDDKRKETKRYIGHQQAIEYRRKKIEKNKNLGEKFLNESKLIGRTKKSKSLAQLSNKDSLSTLNHLQPSRANLRSKYSNSSKHKDYLSEMKKKSLNLTQLQILQKKIEDNKATPEEERYFERILVEASKFEQKAKRKEKYLHNTGYEISGMKMNEIEDKEREIDDAYWMSINAKIKMLDRLQNKNQGRSRKPSKIIPEEKPEEEDSQPNEQGNQTNNANNGLPGQNGQPDPVDF